MDEDNVSLCSVGYPGGNRPVQSPSTMTPQHGWPESNFVRHSPESLASHGTVNSLLIAHGQGASRRSSLCNEDTIYSQPHSKVNHRLSRLDQQNSLALQGLPPPQLQPGDTLDPSVPYSSLRRHSSPSTYDRMNLVFCHPSLAPKNM